jgi:sigma-B regulation protein RsbU (phosphoserine phosphatase)
MIQGSGSTVPSVSIDADEAKKAAGLLERVEAVRMYSSSALHAARYFHFVPGDANVLALADEFQDMQGLPAVAVVQRGQPTGAGGGGAGKVLGIVRKDRLFGLLGKPFGREVLAKSRVSELVEEVPTFDAHVDLFAVAERMLPGGGEYCLLLGPGGRFLGLLASQDLANYLSRMTQEDIELAGRLQERLMGVDPDGGGRGERGSPGIAERRVEAWSRPAKGVGGDFYFTKELADGRLFLALCDVSGKGVAASLIVSMVWGMLTMFDYGRGLKELVLGINESIVNTFQMEKYLTGIFLIYDPAERRLLSADMGHSHAVLFRAGRPRSLKGPRGNLPVGVETEIDPAIYPYRLVAGDELLVYSDGLIEQEDPDGREFGERRLVGTAAAAIARGESLREAVPAALDEHRGGTPQQDDMSFLLLSV